MKFSQMKQVGTYLALISTALLATTAGAATTLEVTHAASAVVAKDAPKVDVGKVVPKVTTTGTVTGNAGNNQYPSGTVPIPPKPKKEGPMATAGTIAVKGGENQYPSGTVPIPPKPKKEGLEAAGAVKAKAAQP